MAGDPFHQFDGSLDQTLDLVDRRIPLSYLFDDIFNQADPRGFGRNLEIVLQVVDYPANIGGKFGALQNYSHGAGDGVTVDLRLHFRLSKLRIELTQITYRSDPWAASIAKGIARTHSFVNLLAFTRDPTPQAL